MSFFRQNDDGNDGDEDDNNGAYDTHPQTILILTQSTMMRISHFVRLVFIYHFQLQSVLSNCKQQQQNNPLLIIEHQFDFPMKIMCVRMPLSWKFIVLDV